MTIIAQCHHKRKDLPTLRVVPTRQFWRVVGRNPTSVLSSSILQLWSAACIIYCTFNTGCDNIMLGTSRTHRGVWQPHAALSRAHSQFRHRLTPDKVFANLERGPFIQYWMTPTLPGCDFIQALDRFSSELCHSIARIKSGGDQKTFCN
jgi:hypothetical protein